MQDNSKSTGPSHGSKLGTLHYASITTLDGKKTGLRWEVISLVAAIFQFPWPLVYFGAGMEYRVERLPETLATGVSICLIMWPSVIGLLCGMRSERASGTTMQYRLGRIGLGLSVTGALFWLITIAIVRAGAVFS
jgi:hypothetical protein